MIYRNKDMSLVFESNENLDKEVPKNFYPVSDDFIFMTFNIESYTKLDEKTGCRSWTEDPRKLELIRLQLDDLRHVDVASGTHRCVRQALIQVGLATGLVPDVENGMDDFSRVCRWEKRCDDARKRIRQIQEELGNTIEER